MTDLIKNDVRTEKYREYDIPGRKEAYRINDPVELYFRSGGSTHRVVDANGIAHCLPAPGVAGCVLR